MSEHKWRSGGRSATDVRDKMLWHGRVGKKAYWHGGVVWDKESGEKDVTEVRWWDADGTLLHQMAASDFIRLKDWPKNIHPSKDTDEDKEWGLHAHLLDDGWTYTFEEAKAFVRKYRYLDIGALYKTEGNFTIIRVEIPENAPAFSIAASNAYNVAPDDSLDWGDGSPIENLTLTQTLKITSSHSYAPGRYVIKIRAGHRWGFPSYENAGSSYQYYANGMAVGGYADLTARQQFFKSVFFGAGDVCSTACCYNFTNLDAVFFANGSDPGGVAAGDGQGPFLGFMYTGLPCLIFPRTMKTMSASFARTSYQNATKPNSYVSNDIFDYWNAKAVCYPPGWTGPNNAFYHSFNPWDKTKNENAIKRIVFTESVADFGRYLGWQPRIQRYWLEAFEIVVPLNPENAPVPSATNSIPSPAGWTDEHVSSGSPTPHPELWDRRKFYVPAGTGEAWKTKLGASHPWSEYVTEISPP
ncbi:MAG: hypothetical protein IJK52_06105 [Oscillospiraceae bacterium]|nr:hypothetical protein [Oscillospiraceae bacterium]